MIYLIPFSWILGVQCILCEGRCCCDPCIRIARILGKVEGCTWLNQRRILHLAIASRCCWVSVHVITVGAPQTFFEHQICSENCACYNVTDFFSHCMCNNIFDFRHFPAIIRAVCAGVTNLVHRDCTKIQSVLWRHTGVRCPRWWCAHHTLVCRGGAGVCRRWHVRSFKSCWNAASSVALAMTMFHVLFWKLVCPGVPNIWMLMNRYLNWRTF